MTAITTHVLDTAVGQPAAGIPVALHACTTDGSWWQAGTATTDADGRTEALPAGDGAHRLIFDLAGRGGFYPEVVVTFAVDAEAEHLHVPLLLGPYGYTTYRGS